jgi:hypothetical protein
VIHLVLPALAPNDARMIFRARSDVRALPYEADAPGKFTPSVMCQGVRFALILLLSSHPIAKQTSKGAKP